VSTKLHLLLPSPKTTITVKRTVKDFMLKKPIPTLNAPETTMVAMVTVAITIAIAMGMGMEEGTDRGILNMMCWTVKSYSS